eukprot:2365074-Lingulodinium_polyedra.AAC.1
MACASRAAAKERFAPQCSLGPKAPCPASDAVIQEPVFAGGACGPRCFGGACDCGLSRQEAPQCPRRETSSAPMVSHSRQRS